jgi:hypothetical protein
MVAVPESGALSPQSNRSVVDFPAPFGPRKPVTVPGWQAKLTSRMPAEPYSLVSCCISIMSPIVVVGRVGALRPIGYSSGPNGSSRRPG